MESRQIQQITNYLNAAQTANLITFYMNSARWFMCDATVNGVNCSVYVQMNDDGFSFELENDDEHQVYNEPIFKLSRLLELINETDVEINNFYIKSADGAKML